MQFPGPATLGLVALLALLSWRAFARFKRMVGRQRLSRARPWITLIVFPLLVPLLAYSARGDPTRIAWMVGGIAIGALLARYGLARTRFDATPQGLFYTPNAHVGIVLSSLFLIRIAYRLVEIYLEPAMPRDAATFARSPLTLAIFGLLAGYFTAYAIGLVRWRARVMAAQRHREAAASEPPSSS